MAEKHAGGRPLKFPTVEILQKKIDDYFASCWRKEYDANGNPLTNPETGEYVKKQTAPYTVSGLAVYLGTFRATLMDYTERDEYYNTIKEAKEKCYAYVEDYLFTGKNPVGAIFSLKNNYGWTDVTKIDATTRIIVGIEEE